MLTFDCYGTLIDWESGITAALKPMLAIHNITLSDDQILTLYAEAEPKAQQQIGVATYREILARVVREIGERLEFTPSSAEESCLADSIKDWRPFSDTVEALQALKRRFKLAIISNVDDDLFADSAKRLQVEFDWVITSEQVGNYKPSHRNFEYAFEHIGVPTERILHVAESLYHDITPATALGLSNVWVNRHQGKEGAGATHTTDAKPDLEVPDLKTLVPLMGLDS